MFPACWRDPAHAPWLEVLLRLCGRLDVASPDQPIARRFGAFADADLSGLPSIEEGFGMVLLQAMAADIPAAMEEGLR